jgi:hypothetical protein
MKRRITKNKLLAKLTKMVDEAHNTMYRCERLKLDNARKEWASRYKTLIEVRSIINNHRI